MAQPASSANFLVISGGVGTTVVKDISANLYRIIIPGTYVGTLKVHDASTAAGTSGSSAIITLGLPTTSIPQSIEVGVSCKSGLVYEATGTPTVTLVWD